MNGANTTLQSSGTPQSMGGWRIIITVAAIGVIWILPALALPTAALVTAAVIAGSSELRRLPALARAW